MDWRKAEPGGRGSGASGGSPRRSRPAKVIVIAGAHSNVGKTELAGRLCSLIPSALSIKLGYGRKKEKSENIFYPAGTSFERIAAEHGGAGYLVIESNSILKEITPHCLIYLPGGSPKPSALLPARTADIVRGRSLEDGRIRDIARKLDLPARTVREMGALAGAILLPEYQPDPSPEKTGHPGSGQAAKKSEEK